MSSFIEIFSCCQKANNLKSKEVDIDSNNQKEEINEKDEKGNINTSLKNKSNLVVEKYLLNQTNSELYSNFMKNNISLDNQNLSLKNFNKLNLDKTEKLLNVQEDYNNFPNNIINNNIINNNIIKITNNNNFMNMNQKDLGFISFCGQSNIDKSNKSLILKAKCLLLSGKLFFNQNLKITLNGLENSLRNKNEFPIYFGIKALVDKDGIPYNDYIVNYIPKKKIKKKTTTKNSNNKNENGNYNEKEIKEKEKEKEAEDVNDDNIKGGRLFQILYDKNKNDYILNYIHNSLILYYRINKLIYLEYDKEYYFILGNVFLSVLVKKLNEKNNIYIRVETEDQKAEKENFEDQKKIVIGRAEDSDVEIDKPCISKTHSIIEYDTNTKKYYYKDNNSTNGSTLLIREDDSVSIKGSMYFKLEDTSFIIKEIE